MLLSDRVLRLFQAQAPPLVDLSQSFPDGFVLRGSMNPAFKQIGNAVPPLVAYAIAMAMRSMIGCRPINDIRCKLLGLDKRLVTTTAGRERKCAS